MKQILLPLFVILPICIFGQKHDATWVYSEYDLIDSAACIRTFSDTSYNFSFHIALISVAESSSASYSLSNGKFHCFSDGVKMYTNEFNMMDGGDSLNYILAWPTPPIASLGSDFYTGIFLPWPGKEDEKTVYLQTVINSHPSNNNDIGTCYSVIDLLANAGSGKVISKQNLLMDSVYQFTCIRHGNGRDWWIVGHKYNNVEFEIQLLTPSGFEFISKLSFNKICYDYNYNRSPIISSEIGDWVYLQFSNHGGYLFDFDRCSGNLDFNSEIAIPDSFDLPNNFNYGMNLPISSPSGRFIYSNFHDQILVGGNKTKRSRLMQADLEDLTPTFQFLTHEEVLGQGFWFPEHGPDGKIYFSFYTNSSDLGFSIASIHRPDDLLDACGLEIPGQLFPKGISSGSTPRFPNYRLGPLVGSECDTVTTSVAVPEIGKTYDMMLTPNPSSGPVEVEITLPEYQGHQVICEVIDGLGRTVSTHSFPSFSYRHTLDVSAFAPGLYVVQLIVDGRVVQAEKMVVARR